MKKNWINSWSGLGLIVSVFLLSCAREQHSDDTKQSHQSIDINDSITSLTVNSVNARVLSNLTTIAPKFGTINKTIIVNGKVTYDKRNIRDISARFAGRIERLWIRYNNQFVKKGQPIAEIYSAELVAAQREFLFLSEQKNMEVNLYEASRRKLTLLGMTDAQLKQLEKQKKVQYRFVLYSDVSGYVMAQQSLSTNTPTTQPESPSTGMEDMGGMGEASDKTISAANTTSNEPQLKVGTYINKGQKLFSINQNKNSKIEFAIPNTKTQDILVGNTVLVGLNSLDSLRIKLNYTQSAITSNEPLIKAWGFTEHNKLKIGSEVVGKMTLQSNAGWVVPKMSVVDMGNKSVVFIKDKNMFKPIVVNKLLENEKYAVIKSNLIKAVTPIAVNAQFLVDSEGFIQINYHE
jgi:multidrug efflux pump subunit AcrA (membrane-fusion protein)